MPLKILILVASSPKPPFDLLQRAQLATWDSFAVPDVTTQYYHETVEQFQPLPKTWVFPLTVAKQISGRGISPALSGLAFQRSLNFEWDFLFRTNASSYVHKSRLQEFCQQMPAQRCYCGEPWDYWQGGEILDGNYSSGCGVILSRDVVTYLANHLGEEPHDKEEDTIIGRCLQGMGIIEVTPGYQRQDIYEGGLYSTLCYHYRCKSPNGNRLLDIYAFNNLLALQQKGII
jgi:hypothetical protein